MLVPKEENELSCICVLVILIFPLSEIFFSLLDFRSGPTLYLFSALNLIIEPVLYNAYDISITSNCKLQTRVPVSQNLYSITF